VLEAVASRQGWCPQNIVLLALETHRALLDLHLAVEIDRRLWKLIANVLQRRASLTHAASLPSQFLLQLTLRVHIAESNGLPSNMH